MAEVGALLVETFGRFLALVLDHTANRSAGFAESSDHPQVSGNSENKQDE